MADGIFQQWAHYFLRCRSDTLPIEKWSLCFLTFNIRRLVTTVELRLWDFWTHKRSFSFCLLFLWCSRLEPSPCDVRQPKQPWGGLVDSSEILRDTQHQPPDTWVSKPLEQWPPEFESPQLRSWLCGAERCCCWYILPEFSTHRIWEHNKMVVLSHH